AMHKAHRIRLNSTPEQRGAFMRAAGTARFAYNSAFLKYNRNKSEGKTVDCIASKKDFRSGMDPEFAVVREVTKCAADEGIAGCLHAMHTYYEAKPQNPKQTLRFPKLRKRSKRIGGFGIANDKFRVAGHEATLPKIGTVNMAEPLRFCGWIVSGRV